MARLGAANRWWKGGPDMSSTTDASSEFARSRFDRRAIGEVLLIIAAGAIGGVRSVLDSWADPVSYPLTMSKFASLFVIPVMKGGAAAGIGVFLLTSLDSSHLTRAFFFALTCGLTFPTVISNGGSYAQSVTSQVASKVIADNVEKLQGPTQVGTDVPQASVPEVVAASTAILTATAKVSPAQAKAADAVVQQAISDLAKTAVASNDPATVDAISNIAGAAAAQNFTGSPDKAVAELKNLRDTESTPELVKARASTVLKKMGRIF
jgi:hypothetical protein